MICFGFHTWTGVGFLPGQVLFSLLGPDRSFLVVGAHFRCWVLPVPSGGLVKTRGKEALRAKGLVMVCHWAFTHNYFALKVGFSLIIRLILGTCGDLLVKVAGQLECPCCEGPRGPKCHAQQSGAAPDVPAVHVCAGRSLPAGGQTHTGGGFSAFYLKQLITRVLLSALAFKGEPQYQGPTTEVLQGNFLFAVCWFWFWRCGSASPQP